MEQRTITSDMPMHMADHLVSSTLAISATGHSLIYMYLKGWL